MITDWYIGYLVWDRVLTRHEQNRNGAGNGLYATSGIELLDSDEYWAGVTEALDQHECWSRVVTK